MVPGPGDDPTFADRFAGLALASESRAPVNAALCRAVARRPDISKLLGHAPETQQAPVLLLAALHHCVLDDPTSELAAWYPTVTSAPRPIDDPGLDDALAEFVEHHRATIVEVVATRHTQTNEVGRCALLLPAFSMMSTEMGALGHVDVGTSAGLTTLLDRYAYRYDDGPLVAGPLAARPKLLIECSTRGSWPIDPATLTVPVIAASTGLDAKPIDLADDTSARWLEACCWPDQLDRVGRLRSAIAIARRHPPDLLAGDAVDAVREAIERLDDRVHPVVTTTWMLSYLSPSQRLAFMAELDDVGSTHDLSWVFAESPNETEEIPHPAEVAGQDITSLVLVTWRGGLRSVRPLGICHPHGYWVHWR